MKRTITVLILACLLACSGLFSAFAFADAAPDDADQVAAVILHTNDVHVGFQDNIGYDGLALYRKELEEVYDHVLLVDAGDAIQGAPIGAISKGAEVIKMMNRVGYDLAVPGNHEFDYGFEALDQCAEDLNCGYTCANFCVTGGGTVFQPWRILEAGDLKIGFVGAVTPDAFTKSSLKDILNEVGEPMYDFLADETGERLCAGLQKAIDEVRQAGADCVILVSHLGNSDVVTERFQGDAVVGRLTGLDLVIEGHAHFTYSRTVTDGEGRQIPVAETGTGLKAFGQIKIYKDGRLEQTLIDSVPAPADIPFETVTRRGVERCVDPEMKAFLDRIVASYAPVMEREIGEVSYDMIVDGDGIDSWVQENGLCDFVTDAYRAVGGTQIAFINASSVRNNLEAGTVTYNDILNLLPYSNDIVTVSLSGQMLLDALEFGVSRLPAGFGGFPQVSGITFRVNTDLESSVVVDEKGQFVSVAGEYRVSDVLVGGEPLDPKAEYTVTSSSFTMSGGDGYSMFKEADILSMTGLPDNEVVMKYLEEYLGGVIPEDYRQAQGRIVMAPAVSDADAGLPDDADQVAAVILHTNDVHVAFQDNIGYDGLALYQKELEKVYDHVLLIDAGDAIQGAPIGAISKGAEIIKMMNRLGYDLAVPGNHEFDYGVEVLDSCAEELACGYTCANFCVTGGETVFQPWRILEAGDLKIGFVGAVTPDTFTKSIIKDVLNEAGEPMYDFLADETGDRLCAGLQKAIDDVRQAGADFVILVSHLGSNNSISAQFRSDAVVGRLTGLDLVIDGHAHETFSHTVTDGEGRQIPMAETGVYLRAIGQIKIYKDGRVEQTLIDSVPAPADLPFETVTRHNAERCVDPEMKAFLDEIVASYAPVMERKIGEVSYDMIVRDANGFDISRIEENGLCELVADAFRARGGTQAALVNAGSVRNNLESGTVTYNDVLNILPYSSDVITIRVTGQMLLDALEFGVSRLPAVSGGFPQVSGISFRVNPGESHVVRDDRGQFVSVDGEYKVSDVMVGGEPLDPKAEYSLAGSSYLLTGGDGYTMFKEADVLSMTGLSDNELLVKYIEEDLSGVIPEDYRAAQGRIVMTPAVSDADAGMPDDADQAAA